MAADTLTVVLVTVFWAAIGIIIPVASFFKNIPNKGVVSVVAALTGFCCWVFIAPTYAGLQSWSQKISSQRVRKIISQNWALCYMHQLNPLIGPLLENTTMIAIMDIWDDSI